MSVPALELRNVTKTFTMHLQGGMKLPVLHDVSFSAQAGQCLVLSGPSGTGKSSILKLIYGNYRCDAGEIWLRGNGAAVDMAAAPPRQILTMRRKVLGYVSQFLRAIPRVPSLDVVAEPLVAAGLSRETSRARAADMLRRFNLPERLWSLPPATFSGGEQQRINIARGFAAERPILLLDEPTASLDATNRAAVVELIEARKRAGAAIVGIFHDEDVRDRVADRIIDVTKFTTEAPGR